MDAELEERKDVLAQGLGAGLAFPADQNLLEAEARLRRLYREARWGQ